MENFYLSIPKVPAFSSEKLEFLGIYRHFCCSILKKRDVS